MLALGLVRVLMWWTRQAGRTRGWTSPTLVMFVRVALSDRVFPGGAVAEVASGTDRYTWTVGVAGEDVRIATDGHFAFAAVGGATVGPASSSFSLGPAAAHAVCWCGAGWRGWVRFIRLAKNGQLMDRTRMTSTIPTILTLQQPGGVADGCARASAGAMR